MRNGAGMSPQGTVEERSEEHSWGRVPQGTDPLSPFSRGESLANDQGHKGSGTGYMGTTKQSLDGNEQVKSALPPQRDVLNHANFGLLPQEKRSIRSLGVSAGVNIAIALAIIFITVEQVHEVQVHRQETLTYVEPPPVKPYVPPVPKVVMPPIPPLPKEEVKVPPPPVPTPQPPKPEIKVEAKAPAMPAPAPKPVVTPPRPTLANAFKSAAPAEQATRVAQTQTAGFGNPVGAHASPTSTASQVPVTGGFGATSSSNQGAASHLGAVASTGFGQSGPSGNPNGSARGVVASTGFGSGSSPAGQPGGHGTVASTGFGQGTGTTGTPGAHGTVASTGFGAGKPEAAQGGGHVQQVSTTPIVVLVKPLPQYTAEAREAHVQGDVQLQVRFTADGRVEVLGVVRGLGHGLDEQARLAAQRIRFKPATRDGKPVDQVSIINVSFQLA